MMPRKYLIISFLILAIQLTTQTQRNINTKHISPLIAEDISFVDVLSDVEHLKEVTKKILIPRVIGTKNHDIVRDFIMESMKDLGWHVETDTFKETVPVFGKVQFDNIIATTHPESNNYLVLACHYDSKYFPNEKFVGAIDSAVPCAMLINLAKTMQNFLKVLNMQADMGLMFIFFDGEEAIKFWSERDSIYGARHLAQKWESENKLKRLNLFLLLDLIGNSYPKFYNYFKNTEEWYMHLVRIEERLQKQKLLHKPVTSGMSSRKNTLYFQKESLSAQIEDDHTPFLRRGVPILHLIPMPFPEEWHTIYDNEEIIDYSAVENIIRILRVFLVEYLKIEM